MTIRIGSLFTGIGLFDLGIVWALAASGIESEVVYQVEIDPFCRACLAQNFPRAQRFVDVTKVQGRDLPRADLICGGFPCQDLSLAGRGAGLDGERSGLWRDFRRLIDETRPRVVCVENTSALVSRGLDVVVGDLERIGYDVEAAIVRASDVGAPHRRERIFIFARLADAVSARREGRGPRGSSVGGEGLADAAGLGRDEGRGAAEARATESRQPDRASANDGGVGQADADGERRQGLAARERTNRGLGLERGDDVARCGEGMADANGDPLRQPEQRGSGRRSRRLRNGGEAIARHDREHGGGGFEPGLGGDAPRLPAWFLRWPARPGDAPAIWEPPRSLVAYSPTRNARLHALGNAIVPQLVAVKFAPLLAEVFA